MKYFLVFFLLLLSFHPLVFAQARFNTNSIDYNELYIFIVNEYGFDQVLANGIYYEDNYWKKVGHQFFREEKLYKGSLMYRGKEYKGMEMKYDIYNQQLIIYLNHDDIKVAIVTPNDFVSSFSLDDKFFIKDNFQGEPKFYQVVYDSEKIKCMYYWYKEMNETDNGGNSTYYYSEFTDSRKRNYLKLNGSVERYTYNRSFTELFPQEIKARVRQYIKTNHIKVAKSSDEKMTVLLTYCNSLL
jgi:hypothetical protein